MMEFYICSLQILPCSLLTGMEVSQMLSVLLVGRVKLEVGLRTFSLLTFAGTTISPSYSTRISSSCWKWWWKEQQEQWLGSSGSATVTCFCCSGVPVSGTRQSNGSLKLYGNSLSFLKLIPYRRVCLSCIKCCSWSPKHAAVEDNIFSCYFYLLYMWWTHTKLFISIKAALAVHLLP